MRVVVLTTHTNNTPILYSALMRRRDGGAIVYDTLPSFDGLPSRVEEINPDWVLYIGAIPHCHPLPVPSIEVLSSIKRPMVHLCCDGADDAWWNLLNEYHRSGCFSLQINIDGVKAGPIGRVGLTTLAPIDPRVVGIPSPWADRKILLGFPGMRMGGDRADVLENLMVEGLIRPRLRDGSTYGEYVSWLKDCRVIWNHPETGGTKSFHVKARVIEAALAGCLVLEKAGSPLANWFEPGVDYLEWSSVSDVALKLSWVQSNLVDAREMALRMRRKILIKYAVEDFWNKVEERIGVRELVS